MIKEIIKKWNANKEKLAHYFTTTPQKEYNEYSKIVEKLFELVINDEDGLSYEVSKITEIDNGDYQGTLIFIIPEETYQPSENQYLFTCVSYGSCSGCDTLQAINSYEDGLPNKGQVKEYMTLALHLVQRTKKLYEETN